jgi:hypothetical protein
MRDDMPHWLSNNAWVTTSLLFDWLYQHMKEGEDVAKLCTMPCWRCWTMGLASKYWGAYSVFGLPTVHLPQEMLVDMAQTSIWVSVQED